MVVCGLRIDEVLELRWSDLDTDYRSHRVERTMTGAGTSSWVIGDDAKTDASRRTITIPFVCSDALHRHRKDQLERRLRIGVAWTDTGAIIDNGAGGHYANPTSFRAVAGVPSSASLTCRKT